MDDLATLIAQTMEATQKLQDMHARKHETVAKSELAKKELTVEEAVAKIGDKPTAMSLHNAVCAAAKMMCKVANFRGVDEVTAGELRITADALMAALRKVAEAFKCD